jgi:hypothetical protein
MLHTRGFFISSGEEEVRRRKQRLHRLWCSAYMQSTPKEHALKTALYQKHARSMNLARDELPPYRPWKPAQSQTFDSLWTLKLWDADDVSTIMHLDIKVDLDPEQTPLLAQCFALAAEETRGGAALCLWGAQACFHDWLRPFFMHWLLYAYYGLPLSSQRALLCIRLWVVCKQLIQKQHQQKKWLARLDQNNPLDTDLKKNLFSQIVASTKPTAAAAQKRNDVYSRPPISILR